MCSTIFGLFECIILFHNLFTETEMPTALRESSENSGSSSEGKY